MVWLQDLSLEITSVYQASLAAEWRWMSRIADQFEWRAQWGHLGTGDSLIFGHFLSFLTITSKLVDGYPQPVLKSPKNHTKGESIHVQCIVYCHWWLRFWCLFWDQKWSRHSTDVYGQPMVCKWRNVMPLWMPMKCIYFNELSM